jgi:glycosyltransferase involved in cell wall biosynthesis
MSAAEEYGEWPEASVQPLRVVPTAPLSGLKVCIVGINFPPEVTGIAPYTSALASAAQGAGAEVRVVTGVPHYPEWRTDRSYRRGIRWREHVDGVTVTRRRHWVPASPGLVGRAAMESSFMAHAIPSIMRDKADVLIAITPSSSALAAAVAARRGRPLGVIVQDLTGNAAVQSGSTGARIGGAIASAEYSMMRKANLVGVIAPQFGRLLTNEGVEADRIRDVPNFTHIDDADVPQDVARRALGWPQDRYLVVHTGNIGMKQGLDVVVAAARLAEEQGSDVDFVVVGDGNQRERLQREAGGLSNIRWVGLLPERKYLMALAAADQLLLCERPGVQEMSLPSKLTSYVAARRPIIASVDRRGITSEYVRSGDLAEMVAPADPAALLCGIAKLRANPARMDALVTSAMAFASAGLLASEARARYGKFIADLAI